MHFTILVAVTVLMISSCTTTTRPGLLGTERRQFMMVTAEEVERMSAIAYGQQNQKAQAEGRLIREGQEFERLKKIGGRIIRQTTVFRDDTRQWKWGLVLINARTINATCMPGGKITFYLGLLRELRLTDDEIAIVMSHEIAHALREHGREKVSYATTQKMISDIAVVATRGKEEQIQLANQVAHIAVILPNSRQCESEADKVGLELAARAGYDPRASISLWRKMEAASGGQNPPQFLSTHPSHETRIADFEALIPSVLSLYEMAPKP